MRVKRIVPNIAAADLPRARAFYEGVLGLDLAMDLGWIRTYSSQGAMQPQLSLALEGGAGTPVPALSIEVDDLDEALARVRAAGIAIEYGPVQEPWGVRRFFVRDPFGTLINLVVPS